MEPEVAAITAVAAATFVTLGWAVEEATPSLPNPWDIVGTLRAAANAGYHRDNLDEVRDLIDPGRLAVIEDAHRQTAADVGHALIRRHAHDHGLRLFMGEGGGDGYDLLLRPTLPCPAVAARDDHPRTVAGRATGYLDWTPFTLPG